MSKAKEKIRKRRECILDYMRHYTDTKGFAPTVREICTALDIKSTSTVHNDIECLVADGYLKKDPAKPRAVVLTEQFEKKKARDRGENPSMVNCDLETINIPLMGAVRAGQPNLAEENIEDYVPVPSRYASDDDYLLKVKGDSMINAGIFDGDILIVEPQIFARNGDIVVAMVEGFGSEATVKRFFKEDGHIRLQPENDSMGPIIAEDVSILGKVKAVFRYNVR